MFTVKVCSVHSSLCVKVLATVAVDSSWVATTLWRLITVVCIQPVLE